MNLDVITNKTYLNIVSPWIEWIDRRECGFTIFDGRSIYRIKQFEMDTSLHNARWDENKLVIGTMDVESGLVDNNEQVAQYLGKYFNLPVNNCGELETLLKKWQREDKLVALFVIPGERLLDERRGVYHYLAYLHESYQISVILHFQTNVFSELFYAKLSQKTCFVQNHSFNPIYPREDQKKFCKVMCQEWGKECISDEDMNFICDVCGDHMLLIKQCLRVMLFQNKSAKKAAIDKSVMDKVDALYSGLDAGLQQILRDIVKNRIGLEEDGLHFLLKMGFIHKSDSRFKISIPLLSQYLEGKLSEMTRLRVVDDEILSGEVNLDAQLTEQEKKVLLKLIGAKEKVVARDELAEAMWGMDVMEKYSDWAIDQVMSRLRRKIAVWGSGRLHTVKGRGFMFFE